MIRVSSSAIDWASAYSCSWRLMEVDADTWADKREVPGIKSASINADIDGQLIESGKVSVDTPRPDTRAEMWARLEVLVSQNGTLERRPVSTFLMSPTSTSVSPASTSVSYDCRSVLKPAHDTVVSVGLYCAAGVDAAKFAAQLLRECTPAPVSTAGSFVLAEPYVFASGTSYLDAAWQIVKAGGWRISIGGDGGVTVGPQPQEPTITIGDESADMIDHVVELDNDTSGIPNRYTVIHGAEKATATDDSPESATSTINRRRYVDVLDLSPTRMNGESLAAYAKRKLAEYTAATGRVTYSRAWVPGVHAGDMIRCSLDRIAGDFRIVTQSITMGSGIEVREVCEVIR